MLLKNNQLFLWNNVSNECGNFGGKFMYNSQLKYTDSIYFTKEKKKYIYTQEIWLFGVSEFLCWIRKMWGSRLGFAS